MLTEALSIALIARQYGRQISLEKVEKAARSENFASEKKFVSPFKKFINSVHFTKNKFSKKNSNLTTIFVKFIT